MMVDNGETIRWSLTALGVLGAILNANQDRRCFKIWIVGNVGWVAMFALRSLWAETALFFVYLVLAIVGLYRWQRPPAGAPHTPCPEVQANDQ